ncbi:hypothetical protein PSHT_05114 [Puccinia striiformis]|uniref:Uncharacterized protein n=1 Tax=Puccinia striiformis TaxID=27350 RepID=A0A2S4WB96_9BASI|nr:hypothetical protein PSHT_05114 [Puccinia striiformis]
MGRLEEQMIFPFVQHNRTPSCLPHKFKDLHYNFPNTTVISILGQLLESNKSCETGRTPPITPYAPQRSSNLQRLLLILVAYFRSDIVFWLGCWN